MLQSLDALAESSRGEGRAREQTVAEISNFGKKPPQDCGMPPPPLFMAHSTECCGDRTMNDVDISKRIL